MATEIAISIGAVDEGDAWDIAYGRMPYPERPAAVQLSEATQRDLEELRKPPGLRRTAMTLPSTEARPASPGASNVNPLTILEDENIQLKKLLRHTLLENAALRESARRGRDAGPL
jgi:hypothetical protein